MFLLLLLQTTYALNLTSSPLPTAGSMQSWTPTISHTAMPLHTITVSHSYSSFSSQLSTETPTNLPQYTDSPSFSPSPEQTQITTSPNQTNIPTSTSKPPANSQVSIYDTLTFKASVGVSIGVLIIAMAIYMKPTSKPIPVHPPFVRQTTQVLAIQNPIHTNVVTGKILADGWKSVTDETGDVWYVNSVTGESSWVPKYKE